MVYRPTWPTDFEKEVVDGIRSAIGRETFWYVVASSEPCPVCDLDPITNTSTNSFCTVCSGDYWIPIYSEISISGHITWGYSEQLGWVTGGQLDEGECRVSIEYSQENLSTVNNARYVVIDDRTMEISNKHYRGVQALNRILVDLIEKES